MHCNKIVAYQTDKITFPYVQQTNLKVYTCNDMFYIFIFTLINNLNETAIFAAIILNMIEFKNKNKITYKSRARKISDFIANYSRNIGTILDATVMK